MLKKSSLIIATCFSAHTACAEDLTDVYQYALSNDPQLKQAIASGKADMESVTQAIAKLAPNIKAKSITSQLDTGLTTANGLASPVVSRFSTWEHGIELTQPIFRFDLIESVQQASHQKIKAEATILAAGQDLIIRVAEQYFLILAARDDLDFGKSQRTAFARQLEQTQQRFDVGLIAITDVHEAKARYDNAVAQELAFVNQVSDEYEKLREITGIPISYAEGFGKDDKIPLSTPMPDNQEAWVDMAHSSNLNILVAVKDAEIAEKEIDIQSSGHLPTVDLSAAATRQKPQLALNNNVNTWNVSLQASLPLFEGGAIMSRTKQARLRYEAALKTLDYTRRSVDSTARQKYRGVLTNIKKVNALAQEVVSRKSALKATQAAYEVGTRAIVDVLDAQSDLLDAQRNYAKSRYDYLLEGLRLKRAAGTLKPNDLYSINNLLETAKHKM